MAHPLPSLKLTFYIECPIPIQLLTKKNIPQYFDVPKPMGEFLDALVSYSESLYATCTGRWSDCPTPDNQQWCAFTAALTSLLSDYAAYGSAASSW